MQQHGKMRAKIILSVILTLLLANTANAEKYFVLDVNYIIGSLTFNSISLRDVDRTLNHNDNSGFLIKSVSYKNADLEAVYYNISENRNYLIYIPYDESAARIEVYNPKNLKVMDIDASSFANTCGNGICEDYESYESCTKDCHSGGKDDFCDGVKDGVCDPDCSPKTDLDCTSKEGNGTITEAKTGAEQKPENEAKQAEEAVKEKPAYSMWILSAFAVIAIFILFLFIKKRKENQTASSLRQYISENISKGFTLQQIKDVLYREGYDEKEIDRAIRSI